MNIRIPDFITNSWLLISCRYLDYNPKLSRRGSMIVVGWLKITAQLKKKKKSQE